jgi:hypothetical protein
MLTETVGFASCDLLKKVVLVVFRIEVLLNGDVGLGLLDLYVGSSK